MGKTRKNVVVVGGSRDFAGAPFLAAITALRAGAESVVVMAPGRVAWTINALSPDLITKKLPGDYLASSHRAAILSQLRTADLLVVGNGAGTRPATVTLMRSLMRWPGRKVVDADALKALRGGRVANAILTPNGREWDLLSRANDVTSLIARGNVIIRKGPVTEILSRGRTTRMPKTKPGLDKAGMGDVLAGLCAGIWVGAPDESPAAAARAALKLGARTAEVLSRKKRGFVFLASDLAAEVRKVRRSRAA